MSKQAKNFNDVCRIFSNFGYSLMSDYRNKHGKTTLVFMLDYGQRHPVNMQYFIGNKFNLISHQNRFYTVTRV